MSVVTELLRAETDGTISFGDYTLSRKAKLDGFEHEGDLYKVKTCQDITKLERNGMFVYESVPGTAVHGLEATGDTLTFRVEGNADTQITVQMEDGISYSVSINGIETGVVRAEMGGKLVLSVELDGQEQAEVRIVKVP